MRVVATSGDTVENEAGPVTIVPDGRSNCWINDAGQAVFRCTFSPPIIGLPGDGAIAYGSPGSVSFLSLGSPSTLFNFSNFTDTAIVYRFPNLLTPSSPIDLPLPGDPVPGVSGATFLSSPNVSRIANDGGLVLAMTYVDDGLERRALFSGFGAGLRLLAVPGGPGNIESLSPYNPVVASGGHFAYAGTWRDAANMPQTAVIAGNVHTGVIQPIALQGQSAVGLLEDLVLWDFSMSIPWNPSPSCIAINGTGDVVFNAWLGRMSGSLPENWRAIVLRRGAELRLLVREGDATPSGGSFGFQNYNHVALSDSGHVLLMAQDLDGLGGNDWVLFRIDTKGEVVELVRLGAPAPGRADGALWNSFVNNFGFGMNQHGDVFATDGANYVVFEASGRVRNLWTMGRRYLTNRGTPMVAGGSPRSIYSGGGGNDGLGRRLNQQGELLIWSSVTPPGPQSIVIAKVPSTPCDSIDFNYDASFYDPADVDAFFSVFSEGPCVPATGICGDPDFNNDNVVDPLDVESFLSVFGEGSCL